jgi:hypothetical protein
MAALAQRPTLSTARAMSTGLLGFRLEPTNPQLAV